MNRTQFLQTSFLAIIAICVIVIVFQNQIIINKFSQEKLETPFVRQASFRKGQNFIAVPVNRDGTIDVNVKTINETIDVNIDEVGGFSTFGKVPVKIKD